MQVGQKFQVTMGNIPMVSCDILSPIEDVGFLAQRRLY